QYNQRTDRILEDVIINYPNLVIQDQLIRARRVYRDREREQGETRLMADYFVDNPTRDATGRQSLSSLQKCTGAMRVLAYGVSFDAVDEYLRMSGAVTRKSLMSFVQGVISCFGDEYLRRPNEDDLARLLNIGEQRGFPGMIGSIDCMHWQWKNCPTGWAGQYAGRSGKPTIILEAVASYDLWIWHAFFGTPGSCNDINVLHRSPVFNDVLEGRAPKVSYVVNGNQKNMAYYLTDGIYPSWAAFVKSISSPQIRKHRLFAQHQEAVRKDVERAFGVLQARFAFLRHPLLIAGLLENPELALDALSVSMGVQGIVFMVSVGFNAAASVRVGNELGAGNPKAAAFSVLMVTSVSFIITVVESIIIFSVRDVISYAFTPGETVANAVSELCPLLVITIILNGIQPVLSGVAVGCGWQAYVAYVNIGCYYVVGIPLGFLLGFYFDLGVKGIWSGMIEGTGMQTADPHFTMVNVSYRLERRGGKGYETLG
ncbi:putative nuclease HARBI1, partial [Tanacetum coccineum]